MNLFGQLTQLIGRGKKDDSPWTEGQELLLSHAVEMTDRRIAKVAGFQETLWPAIQFTRIYFSEVLESIPGPFYLDRDNPILDEIFHSPEEVTACLGRSIATKHELPHHIEQKRKRVCALLGVRPRAGKDEKFLLGDHTIRSLRRSPGSLRRSLLRAIFDSILQGFANQNLHYEKKLAQLHVQQETLRRLNGIASPQDEETHVNPPEFPKLTRDPKEVLERLVDELHNPTNRIQLSYDNGHTLTTPSIDCHMPRLVTQDRRHWFVCMVEFPVEMAEEALKKETYNHRFILI